MTLIARHTGSWREIRVDQFLKSVILIQLFIRNRVTQGAVNLAHANLRIAVLHAANLTSANPSQAYLSGANLREQNTSKKLAISKARIKFLRRPNR